MFNCDTWPEVHNAKRLLHFCTEASFEESFNNVNSFPRKEVVLKEVVLRICSVCATTFYFYIHFPMAVLPLVIGHDMALLADDFETWWDRNFEQRSIVCKIINFAIGCLPVFLRQKRESPHL